MTVKEVKIRSRLDCSYHVLVKFMISMNMGLAKSGVRTLNFRRVNFRLLKVLLDEISWEEVFRNKGVEQGWLLFKDAFLRAQDLSIPQKRKEKQVGEAGIWHEWQGPVGQTEGKERQVQAM